MKTWQHGEHGKLGTHGDMEHTDLGTLGRDTWGTIDYFVMRFCHGPRATAHLPVPTCHCSCTSAHFYPCLFASALLPCSFALCHLLCHFAMCLCQVPLPCGFCLVPFIMCFLPCATAVCSRASAHFTSANLQVPICQCPFASAHLSVPIYP